MNWQSNRSRIQAEQFYQWPALTYRLLPEQVSGSPDGFIIQSLAFKPMLKSHICHHKILFCLFVCFQTTNEPLRCAIGRKLRPDFLGDLMFCPASEFDCCAHVCSNHPVFVGKPSQFRNNCCKRDRCENSLSLAKHSALWSKYKCDDPHMQLCSDVNLCNNEKVEPSPMLWKLIDNKTTCTLWTPVSHYNDFVLTQ